MLSNNLSAKEKIGGKIQKILAILSNISIIDYIDDWRKNLCVRFLLQKPSNP